MASGGYRHTDGETRQREIGGKTFKVHQEGFKLTGSFKCMTNKNVTQEKGSR